MLFGRCRMFKMLLACGGKALRKLPFVFGIPRFSCCCSSIETWAQRRPPAQPHFDAAAAGVWVFEDKRGLLLKEMLAHRRVRCVFLMAMGSALLADTELADHVAIPLRGCLLQ